MTRHIIKKFVTKVNKNFVKIEVETHCGSVYLPITFSTQI